MFTKSRLITVGVSAAAAAILVGYLLKQARENPSKDTIAKKIGLV